MLFKAAVCPSCGADLMVDSGTMENLDWEDCGSSERQMGFEEQVSGTVEDIQCEGCQKIFDVEVTRSIYPMGADPEYYYGVIEKH